MAEQNNNIDGDPIDDAEGDDTYDGLSYHLEEVEIAQDWRHPSEYHDPGPMLPPQPPLVPSKQVALVSFVMHFLCFLCLVVISKNDVKLILEAICFKK